jgi:addiction module HigA family antidote
MLPSNRISTHPGEILKEEFLVPLGISMNALARAIRVPANRISDIVAGERGVSADTAMRLARYFRTSDEFWMNLQATHDLSKTRATHRVEIERDVQPLNRKTA